MKFLNIIKTTTLSVLVALAAVTMVSCDGEDGAPGPAGQDAQSMFWKTGSFKGTITGTRSDGTAFTVPFDYQYSEDAYEGFGEDGNETWISRYEQANWESGYMGVRLYRGEGNELSVGQLYTYFHKEIAANKMFYFNLNTQSVEASNIVYNEANGALSFDFTHTGTENSTGNSATITGKFTTGSGKVYGSIVTRK